MGFFKVEDFGIYNMKEFLAAYLNSVVSAEIAEVLCTEV